MTLHRRGVSRADLLAELARELEEEHRHALWPALTMPGTASERLAWALTGECELAERKLELLGALGESARAALFHEDEPEALSRAVYVAPLERLLADGTLRAVEDPPETPPFYSTSSASATATCAKATAGRPTARAGVSSTSP